MSIVAANAAVARAAAAPLSERLRQLVMTVAKPATLTCQFSPGGRVTGAGIISQYHCVHCNQSLIWHEVAASIAHVAFSERVKASGVPAGEELTHVTSDR